MKADTRERATLPDIFYRKLFENAAEAIFLMSDNVFIECNDATLRMYGGTREQILGKTPYYFSPEIQPDGKNSKKAALERIGAALSGTPQIFEWVHRRADGTLFDADISLIRIDVDGKRFVQAVVRDISDRKRLERKLLEEEKRIRVLNDNITSGMVYQILVPKDGSFKRFTYVSESVKELYGCTPEEAIADPEKIYGRVHKDDLPALIRAEEKALKDFSQMRAEVRIVSPSGKIRWSSFVSSPRRLNDGSQVWEGIEFDITDLKSLEETIRNSEERFRAIFNSTYQFTGLLTVDGLLIEANTTALDYAGVVMTDVSGMPFWETPWWTGHKDRVERLKDAIKRAAGGEFVRYETELNGAGGRKGDFDFSLKPILGKDGKVHLIVPEARDITERRLWEDKLRHFQIAVDSCSDAIGMTTPDGRHCYQNEALTRMFGYTCEEIVDNKGFPFNVYVDSKQGEEVFRTIMGGLPWSGELKMRNRQGNIMDILLRAYPIKNQSGKIIGLVGIHTDITQRKRMELELKEKIESLELFNKVAVGREERILELKEEVERLKQMLEERQ